MNAAFQTRSQLPPETWCAIASYLSPEGRLNLSNTCTAMHALVFGTNVWAVIDFSADKPDETRLDWIAIMILEAMSLTAKLGVREIIFDHLKVSDYVLELVLEECPQAVKISLEGCYEFSIPSVTKLVERAVNGGIRLPLLQQFVIPLSGSWKHTAGPKLVTALRTLAMGREVLQLCQDCRFAIAIPEVTCGLCETGRSLCWNRVAYLTCESCCRYICDSCSSKSELLPRKHHRLKQIVESCATCWESYKTKAKAQGTQSIFGKSPQCD
ncbi:hypothetical protein BC937DRAFT_93922 [Endogone sp. FLAS-F59071]|nr:hypothetical protein BC937DRAFT_93922 [Endogone sp. FLAS-F59071]|eukprot:RUS14376.1 hypothetical protein BC937DRAFT_93922 [Endogone sp. FLAS-F59071]